jgi:hypothetical protein
MVSVVETVPKATAHYECESGCRSLPDSVQRELPKEESDIGANAKQFEVQLGGIGPEKRYIKQQQSSGQRTEKKHNSKRMQPPRAGGR